MSIATNLQFGGNCEEALSTYQGLFNAQLLCMHKFTAKHHKQPGAGRESFSCKVKD